MESLRSINHNGHNVLTLNSKWFDKLTTLRPVEGQIPMT